MIFENFRFDYQNYLILLTAIINLSLCVIFLKAGGYKKLSNISFGILTLGVSLWSIGMFFYRGFFGHDLAVFWSKFLYFSSGITPLALLFFSYVFPEKDRQLDNIFTKIILIAPILLLLSVFIPGFVITEIIVNRNTENIMLFGYGYYLWGGYLTLYFVMAFYKLYRSYVKSQSLAKLQIKYILIGGIISTTLGSITNFILPTFGNTSLGWTGQSFTLILAVCIAYAISRYRLMGIRFIASRIYTYFLIGAFSYLYFHLVIFFDLNVFGNIYAPASLISGIVFAIIFALIFLPLLGYVQKTSDVIFYKGNNPRSIIKDLLIKLSSVINLDQLISILAKEFKKIIESDEIVFVIFTKNTHYLKFYFGDELKISDEWLNKSDKLIKKIAAEKRIILIDSDEKISRELSESLAKNKVRIVSPLIARGQAIGLIFFGDKISRSAYTDEDMEFLEIISSQAAASIENARLYQEVDDYNKNLQEKVDLQTADIKAKNEQLEKLLVMRSEFLDIASHQLRTPVSVIKGMLSMLQEGSVPEAKKMPFISASFQKSLKLAEIIDDILRASEMDSQKFELSLVPVEIEPIVNDIIEDKKPVVEFKKISLTFEHPAEPLPPVLSEARYLKHVIYNLINNALQYTTQGYIKVKAAIEGDNVVIRVEDTGLGIPEADLPKLFQKFSRAKNAVDAYTDGSGLGLFIIKEIIDKHQGAKIYIEKTELDKGTTFVLSLPIAK